jgi:CRISPR-associated protein Cmr2
MNYLLQITTGPIQGFIATARRTRDLWFGSWVLSELSKAVAKSLQDGGANLIFPSPTAPDADLAPNSEFLVVNIIVARIVCKDVAILNTIATDAKNAAQTRWEALCEEARIDCLAAVNAMHLNKVTQFLRENVWNAQRPEVLEVYWVAAPIADNNYPAASLTMRNAMAMRKNTRDARQFQDTSAFPKSSLDGVRSTVLQEAGKGDAANVHLRKLQRVRQQLGIAPAEQLDLPGLVKRVLGRNRSFVPVARIAADAWLQRVISAQPNGEQNASLVAIREACQALYATGLVTRLTGTKYSEYTAVEGFNYDGQFLFQSRLDLAIEEAKKIQLDQTVDADDRVDAKNTLTHLVSIQNALRTLRTDFGSPSPYYAILLADGDRMGELIDVATAHGIGAHQRVSRALIEFAQAVPGYLNTPDLRGAGTYSGGDDVLAFVRLDKAIACANLLRTAFKETLGAAIAELNIDLPNPPTLSVGIAIGHILEPLGDVRELASRAEKIAKGADIAEPAARRNAVGILIKPRSGGEYSTRIQWTDDVTLRRLERWKDQFANDSIPSGLPYELRAVYLQEVKKVFEDNNGNLRVSLWAQELALVLSKKRGIPVGVKKEILDGLTAGDPMEGLDLMLVARWFSGHHLEDLV